MRLFVRIRSIVVRVASVVVVLVLPLSVPVHAATGTATLTRGYAGSAAVFPNPDRGFYHYTATHYFADRSGYVPLDGASLARWRTQDSVALVYRVFYLEKFAAQDDIDSDYLALVAADLLTARAAGVRLVVRFAYSETDGRDATPVRVVRQIQQLAPVLNAGSDVVAVLQAGFIGKWGERYYTDNFAHDPAHPWDLSAADWTARQQVLTTLLASTKGSIYLQVRYPAIKQRLLPAGDPRAARVGIDDDCFLASADDYGTFAVDGDRQWLAQQTQTVPMGGETCAVNGTRSQWPSAQVELGAYHWSFLNADFNTDVLNSWGPTGLAEVSRRLGYRLRLLQTTFPASTTAGGLMPVQLSLTNDGYAAPFRARPVQLVMRSPDRVYRVALPVDVRAVQPGRTVVLPLQLTAPPTPGNYALSLALPDAAPELAGRPEYAVRLANDGLWDAADGENDLQQNVQVTPAGTSSSPTAGVDLSALTPTAASNGWGPFERDMSNGEQAAGDGGVLRLRGVQYPRGLGAHSMSSLTYPLNGKYGTFSASVGVDDETAGRGSVSFQVYVDGVLRYASPVLTGTAGPLPVGVAVAGGQSLRLVVTDGGDGPAYDHADWAAARLEPPISQP